MSGGVRSTLAPPLKVWICRTVGAETINAWVNDHTKGKIPKIVSQQALASAITVLTNAVYFHGQ